MGETQEYERSFWTDEQDYAPLSLDFMEMLRREPMTYWAIPEPVPEPTPEDRVRAAVSRLDGPGERTWVGAPWHAAMRLRALRVVARGRRRGELRGLDWSYSADVHGTGPGKLWMAHLPIGFAHEPGRLSFAGVAKERVLAAARISHLSTADESTRLLPGAGE